MKAKEDERVHVRPKPGLVVRDPVRGGVLPPEGRLVQWSIYWRRRLRDESIDVVAANETEGR